MTTLQAFVLGLIQGLGEFLPISSSAHLVILPDMLGWNYQGITFDILLHLATLIAIAAYFWKDWLTILQDGLARPKTQDGHILWLLALATIPAGIAGVLFEDKIETTFRAPAMIALLLMVFAVILWAADRKAETESKNPLNLRNALLIGCAQMLALMPGVSRSGVTITAALFLGFSRKDSARLSFLLATPIIAGAAVLALRKLNISDITVPLLLGFATALVSGWCAIKFLMSFVRTRSYTPFVIYRLALGILIFTVLSAR